MRPAKKTSSEPAALVVPTEMLASMPVKGNPPNFVMAPCKTEDAKKLAAAGFRPVVRWVDVNGRSDVPLKTIEALTLLDRRKERGSK